MTECTFYRTILSIVIKAFLFIFYILILFFKWTYFKLVKNNIFKQNGPHRLTGTIRALEAINNPATKYPIAFQQKINTEKVLKGYLTVKLANGFQFLKLLGTS